MKMVRHIGPNWKITILGICIIISVSACGLHLIPGHSDPVPVEKTTDSELEIQNQVSSTPTPVTSRSGQDETETGVDRKKESDSPDSVVSTSETLLTTGESDDTGMEMVECPEPVALDVPTNASIERCIRYYARKHPRDVTEGLKRGREYLPMIYTQLCDRGIPVESMWIPLIESGFRLHARSPSYAKGMWQLMPFTARRFGLRIDDWVDERVDPGLSTVAALDALEYFHDRMGCWLLAFAAYNSGEGRVNRAIREVGSRDFWRLASAKKLPSQTRFYVNAILALHHISQHADLYGFDFSFGEESSLETVYLNHQAALQTIAACAELPTECIKSANPALKRFWTPPDYERFPLKLPADSVGIFQRSFTALDPEDYKAWTSHTVKSGDTLSEIASSYASTVKEIMRANGLEKTLIRAGSTLLVPTGIIGP